MDNILNLMKKKRMLRISILFYINVTRNSTALAHSFKALVHKLIDSDERFRSRCSSLQKSHTDDVNYEALEVSKVCSHCEECIERKLRQNYLPEVPMAVKIYQGISTVFMIFVMIRNTMPMDHIFREYLKLEMPYNCYLPGRFVLNLSASRVYSIGLVGIHLSYRLWAYLAPSKVQGAFLFLYGPETSIRRQYKLNYECRENYSNTNIVNKLDYEDLLVRYVLCFAIRKDDRILHRIRPNRTPEAYRKLVHHMSKANLYIYPIIVSATTITSFICLREIFSDASYLQSYPGCSPALEKYYNISKNFQDFDSIDSSSITLSWQRFYVFLFDFCENIFIWADTGWSLAGIISMIIVINYDLLQYWHHLGYRLKDIILQMKMTSAFSTSDDKITERLKVIDNITRKGWTAHRKVLPEFYVRRYEIEESINDLLAEFRDFFDQIEIADGLISDLLSVSLIIWAVSFGAIIYSSFGNKFSGYTLGIYLCQTFGFIMVTVMSAYLLVLDRQVRRSYIDICTLMAYDCSRYRNKLTKILEYLTRLKRSAYTLMRTHPFVAVTYLSFIGWTISGTIIAVSLSLDAPVEKPR